jgi:membrane-associated phospholipid phosphatase
MRSVATTRGVIAACAATTAVALGVCAHSGASRRLNRAVRRAIRPKRGPRIVKVAKAMSYFGVPTLHPLVAIAASLAISGVKRRPAPSAAIASILVVLLDKGARVVVHQRRPPRATKHSGLNRFAYPSGHTAAAAAITLAAAIDLGEGRSREEQALLFTASCICTIAVGWSRLELDEHWIDDVIGGWATGVASAIATVSAVDALTRR